MQSCLSRSKEPCEFPAYPCNPLCQSRRIHVNSYGIRALRLSRSKDPSEFLGYACTPACRGRRIHMNSKGIRAALLVEVEGSV